MTYCYLFVTKGNPRVLKFGKTNSKDPFTRLAVYSGLNKVETLLGLAWSTNDFELTMKNRIHLKEYCKIDKSLGCEWVLLDDAVDLKSAYKNITDLFFNCL